MRENKVIITALYSDFKSKRIDVENVLLALSEIGFCPNILNNDNGKWALSTSGYQTVVTGRKASDVETSFFVEKKYWKNSVRQAVLYYLKESINESYGNNT